MTTTVSTAASVQAARAGRLGLNPAQRRVFDDLLAIGAPRPIVSPVLADHLRAKIVDGTADALGRWTEPRLFLSKSQLVQALNCEGLVQAEAAAATRDRPLHPATAVGIVTHRAIQLAHTHPGATTVWYVEQSVAASLAEDGFASFWAAAAPGTQSDVQVQALSRTTAFLDTFPPLDPAWGWRFEEPVQARVGNLTLGGRIDLVLGRPKADGRQTMFLCDLKTGGLHESHDREASFYALVATLRHGVPPFRSTVLSLSSGEWSDPDVDERRLLGAADDVVAAVNATVAALCEHRPVELRGGLHCRYCPAREGCAAAV